MIRAFAAFLFLAGCADGYDRAGYKLPGDCAEAARLTADVPVVRTSEHELAHIAGRRVFGMTSYRMGADGKPIKETATIYMANNLSPDGGSYASILCHEKFHVLLGAWHE